MGDRKRVTICMNGDLAKQKCVLLQPTWEAFVKHIEEKFGVAKVVCIKNARGGEIDELELIRDDEQLFVEAQVKDAAPAAAQPSQAANSAVEAAPSQQQPAAAGGEASAVPASSSSTTDNTGAQPAATASKNNAQPAAAPPPTTTAVELASPRRESEARASDSKPAVAALSGSRSGSALAHIRLVGDEEAERTRKERGGSRSKKLSKEKHRLKSQPDVRRDALKASSSSSSTSSSSSSSGSHKRRSVHVSSPPSDISQSSLSMSTPPPSRSSSIVSNEPEQQDQQQPEELGGLDALFDDSIPLLQQIDDHLSKLEQQRAAVGGFSNDVKGLKQLVQAYEDILGWMSGLMARAQVGERIGVSIPELEDRVTIAVLNRRFVVNYLNSRTAVLGGAAVAPSISQSKLSSSAGEAVGFWATMTPKPPTGESTVVDTAYESLSSSPASSSSSSSSLLSQSAPSPLALPVAEPGQVRVRGWFASDLPSFAEVDSYADGRKKDKGDKRKLAESKLIAAVMGHQQNLVRPSEDALDNLARLANAKLDERERIVHVACGYESVAVLTSAQRLLLVGGARSELVRGLRDGLSPDSFARFRQPVRRVSMGTSHCFVQAVSGELYSWGINTDRDLLAMNGSSDKASITGLLGHSITSDVSTSALRVTLLYPQIIDIASGPGHTCVLVHKGDNKIVGFGSNGQGQLGVVRKTNLNSVIMDQLRQQQLCKVYCGGEFTLALDSMGVTYAWGSNSHGQLGVGKAKHTSTPVTVSYPGLRTGTRIVALACGYAHCLALTNTGCVYSWGDNRRGQLGRPAKAFDRPKPVPQFADPTCCPSVASIAAHGHRSMAVTDLGVVYEWGALQSRNLLRDQDTPTAVQALQQDGQFVELAAPGGFHSAYVEEPAMKAAINLLGLAQPLQMAPEFLAHIANSFMQLTVDKIARCRTRALSSSGAPPPRVAIDSHQVLFDLDKDAATGSVYPCQPIYVTNLTDQPLFIEVVPSSPACLSVLPSQHVQLTPRAQQPIGVQLKDSDSFFCAVLRIAVSTNPDPLERPLWVFCHRRLRTSPGIPAHISPPGRHSASTSNSSDSLVASSSSSSSSSTSLVAAAPPSTGPLGDSYAFPSGGVEDRPWTLRRLSKHDALLCEQVLFRQEVFLLRQLASCAQHPAARNLVQFLGAREDDAYIECAVESFEFSLRNILDELPKQALQPEQLFPLTDHLVANFLGQIADGLLLLNSLPYPVHYREISSANVFVQSPDFTMKIGHGGASLPVAPSQRLPSHQLGPVDPNFSEAQQVYDLGLLLYELLTLCSARHKQPAPQLDASQLAGRGQQLTELYAHMTHPDARQRPQLSKVAAAAKHIASGQQQSPRKAKKSSSSSSSKAKKR